MSADRLLNTNCQNETIIIPFTWSHFPLRSSRFSQTPRSWCCSKIEQENGSSCVMSTTLDDVLYQWPLLMISVACGREAAMCHSNRSWQHPDRPFLLRCQGFSLGLPRNGRGLTPAYCSVWGRFRTHLNSARVHPRALQYCQNTSWSLTALWEYILEHFNTVKTHPRAYQNCEKTF